MVQDAQLGSLLTRITGQILWAIAPAHLDWKNMQAEIKSRETNCNIIKNIITIVKENHEKESAILKWISSHDIRESYQTVLELTGIEEKYNSRCQWLLDHTEFEEWSNLGNNSVLWLKGTIGTGKTTLMARAIREMQNTTRIEEYGIAFFFFQRATGRSSVETCLRSLVRQLSWNKTSEEIEPLVEKKYEDFKATHSGDSLLSIGECRKLLKKLTSKRETYIMIDAIDECEKPHELLSQLMDLNEKGHQALHIMLCGRDDLLISDYFDKCLTIATNSADTSEDQEFYINHEVDNICRTRKGSLFASPSKDYSCRLKKVLKEKGGGLFRWIEIQLDVFRVGFFKTSDDIEKELEWLKSHTKHDTLDKEYARLLALNGKLGLNYNRALKMLRLIACSREALSVDDLAEAITASEYADDSTKELTPDDVRRILVGFISETKPVLPLSALRRQRRPTVQLAHSSVLEYLTDEYSDVEGFSTLAQHSEAALLCFSRIFAVNKPPELPLNAESSPSDEASVEEDSYFLKYSCINWPSHCRRAFDEDPECSLVEKAKEFILSGRCMWEDHLRYRDRIGIGRLSWKDTLASPGFVIVEFNLTELLRFPEIRALIDFQLINDHGDTLLYYSLKISLPSTIDRLIELNPNQVRPSKGQATLVMAAGRGLVSVVEKLLENGEDVNVRDRLGKSALYLATAMVYLTRSSVKEETIPALLNTIRILLQNGADIFDTNDDPWPLLRLVAHSDLPALSDLFVERAKQLEESGLVGSVQRLESLISEQRLIISKEMETIKKIK